MARTTLGARIMDWLRPESLRTRMTDLFRFSSTDKRHRDAHLTALTAIKNSGGSATIEDFKKQMEDCYDVEMLIAIADAFQNQLIGANADEDFKAIFHAELEAWLKKHRLLAQKLAIVISTEPATSENIDNTPVATVVPSAATTIEAKARFAKVVFFENPAPQWNPKKFLTELSKPSGAILIELVKKADDANKELIAISNTSNVKPLSFDQSYFLKQKSLVLNKSQLDEAKADIFRIPFIGQYFSETRERSFVKKVIRALELEKNKKSKILNITTGFFSRLHPFDRNELLVLIRSDKKLFEAFNDELGANNSNFTMEKITFLSEDEQKLFEVGTDGVAQDYIAAVEKLVPSLAVSMPSVSDDSDSVIASLMSDNDKAVIKGSTSASASSALTKKNLDDPKREGNKSKESTIPVEVIVGSKKHENTVVSSLSDTNSATPVGTAIKPLGSVVLPPNDNDNDNDSAMNSYKSGLN